jgi:hypothetical protein
MFLTRIRRFLMEPVKTDQVLYCETCGVELKVVKDCDTSCVCNIVCCDQPMKLKESREKVESGAE